MAEPSEMSPLEAANNEVLLKPCTSVTKEPVEIDISPSEITSRLEAAKSEVLWKPCTSVTKEPVDVGPSEITSRLEAAKSEVLLKPCTYVTKEMVEIEVDPSERTSRLEAAKNEILLKPYVPAPKEDMPDIDELLKQSKEHLDMMDIEPEVETSHGKAVALAESEEEDDDDVPYLSEDKPFFDVILAQSHVNPGNHLQLPRQAVKDFLPFASVPVVMKLGRKRWDMTYLGDTCTPRLAHGWKRFVTDNDLQEGDALVFEIMECNRSKIIFKVQILSCELPPELQATVDSWGVMANPINLD